jgi:hypothetical protein
MGFSGYKLYIKSSDDLATMAAKVFGALGLYSESGENTYRKTSYYLFGDEYPAGYFADTFPGLRSFLYSTKKYQIWLGLEPNHDFGRDDGDGEPRDVQSYCEYYLTVRSSMGYGDVRELPAYDCHRWVFPKLKALDYPLVLGGEYTDVWDIYDPKGELPLASVYEVQNQLPREYSLLIQSQEGMETVAETLGQLWDITFAPLPAEGQEGSRFAFARTLPKAPFAQYVPGISSFINHVDDYRLELLLEANPMTRQNEIAGNPVIEEFQYRVLLRVQNENLDTIATADYMLWAWEQLTAAKRYRAHIYAVTKIEHRAIWIGRFDG